MASSDWLPLATTALGGLLAAGGGALVQWTGSHRADKRARDDLRRETYVALVAACDDLLREFKGGGPENREARMGAIGGVEHACAAVALAGPSPASGRATMIKSCVLTLLAGERSHDAAKIGASLRILEEEYIRFVETAQFILGTNEQLS